MASTGDDLSFDPETVPIRPAATVMLLADRPELEVLMLKRNARIVFAGDMWVYPGGRVDEADAEAFEPHCQGVTDEQASTELGVESGGLAFWIAAIRECFEEAGLILGTIGDVPGRETGELTARLVEHRDALNAGERSFLEIVRAESITLDATLIHPIAHWVTPVGSPRRYDTRFFVAAMPAGQQPVHDDHEAVGHGWFEAADALQRQADGEMIMMTPTIRMLQCLAQFDSAEAAVTGGRATLEPHQVRVDRAGGDRGLLLPGDDGYAAGDPGIETGFVSWRPEG